MISIIPHNLPMHHIHKNPNNEDKFLDDYTSELKTCRVCNQNEIYPSTLSDLLKINKEQNQSHCLTKFSPF